VSFKFLFCRPLLATPVAVATNFGTQFTKLCKAGRYESIYKLYSLKNQLRC